MNTGYRKTPALGRVFQLKEFVMKKKIALLLVVFMLSGSALWANSFSFWAGLASIVVGGALAATPIAVGGDPAAPGSLALEVTGAGFIIAGIIVLITGSDDDDDSYAQAENPILKHTSFGVSADRLYMGAKFSF
jgi:hypothetical protein